MSDELHSLAAAYALNAIGDIAEENAFEEHLEHCSECVVAVRDFRETAASVAEGLTVDPPESLRSSVLNQLGSTEQVPSENANVIDLTRTAPARPDRRLVLAGMAAAVVLLVGLFGLLTPSTVSTGLDEIAQADDALVSEVANGESILRVVWSPSMERAALTGSGFAPPSVGEAYQLWLISDGAVRPAGVFTPTDGDVALVVAAAGSDAQAWGITLEPEDGSLTPTSDVLYTGTF